VVVVQIVVVNLYRTIYLSMCLSICLSYCIYLSFFLSFFLFLHLSYLILSYVILSISVSLSLFLFRSGYLSVYLQAGKRSYAARLPQFFNLKTSKTQQLSETVSIREFDGCRRVVRTPLFFFALSTSKCPPLPWKNIFWFYVNILKPKLSWDAPRSLLRKVSIPLTPL
jgi:hypothetical protein